MRFFHFVKYKLLRPAVSWSLWKFYSIFFYEKIKQTKSGEALKNGITAVVPVYNEEYHLGIVLESLIGMADQIVILNNGSIDNSHEVCIQFQKKYSGECEIEILNLPKHTLADALNEGLARVKYDWLLRWDGDFICFNKLRFQELKQSFQKRKRPAAFRLPYINLCGDYNHAFKPTGTVYAGEFYLRSFNRELKYELEKGRLEVCVIPLYYKLQEEELPYIIHLGHVKPVTRIMYRHMYMDWIDTLNNFPGLKSMYVSIDSFRNDWLKNVIETENFSSAKFRFSRLMAVQCEPVSDSLKNAFPDILKDFIKTQPERFSVIYENGKPCRIMDKMDAELMNYFPTKEDLAWQPDYKKFYTRNFRLHFLFDLLKR